jgi:hypothetical protein
MLAPVAGTDYDAKKAIDCSDRGTVKHEQARRVENRLSKTHAAARLPGILANHRMHRASDSLSGSGANPSSPCRALAPL